jgi:hypothetical protein
MSFSNLHTGNITEFRVQFSGFFLRAPLRSNYCLWMKRQGHPLQPHLSVEGNANGCFCRGWAAITVVGASEERPQMLPFEPASEHQDLADFQRSLHLVSLLSHR